MAKQRVVNTRFWDDDYVMELDPNGKLLFLYFITNPLTDLCGAYQITIKRMVFDTGIKAARIQELLSQFETDGKIIHRDGWLVMRNFGKHQQGNSPNVKKGAARSLNTCPDWIKQTLSNPSYTPRIEIAPVPVGTTCRDNPDLTEQPEPEPRPDGKAEPPKAASPEPKTDKPGAKIYLPAEFQITEEMRKWAESTVPLVDIDSELEEFINFWREIATKNNKRTFRGWVATWQKRMRDISPTGNRNGTNRSNYPSKRTDADVLAESEQFYSDYPA